MLAGPQVMLDVIAVIEEQPVVEPAVMAGRPADMLEASLKPAQAESKSIPRQVDADEEHRRHRGKSCPHRHDNGDFDPDAPRPAEGAIDAAVMTKVPGAPQPLRYAEKRARVDRERAIQGARSEERTVNEVVRDRIGIPPQGDGDDGNRRHANEHQQVDEGKRDEEAVPWRMAE